MVRIASMPSPLNVGGRRTPPQGTIARTRWRPEIREAKRERGTQPDVSSRAAGTA
jgi:hypothetical protein